MLYFNIGKWFLLYIALMAFWVALTEFGFLPDVFGTSDEDSA
jgi:hypothetical protein